MLYERLILGVSGQTLQLLFYHKRTDETFDIQRQRLRPLFLYVRSFFVIMSVLLKHMRLVCLVEEWWHQVLLILHPQKVSIVGLDCSKLRLELL